MGRSPPPSRKAAAARKVPTAGPSKPRKVKVPSKNSAPIPFTRNNHQSGRHYTRRESASSLSDVEMAPPAKPPVHTDKGKARMLENNDEQAPALPTTQPVSSIGAAREFLKRVEKARLNKGDNTRRPSDRIADITDTFGAAMHPPKMVPVKRAADGQPPTASTDMVVDNPRPNAAMPPPDKIPVKRNTGPSAAMPPPKMLPAKRRSPAMSTGNGAEVVRREQHRPRSQWPIYEGAERAKPEPMFPPFDFEPLMRNPPLISPRRFKLVDFNHFSAEAQIEAQEIRNAVAVYRERRLESIVPIKNWDVLDISSWSHFTSFKTGKLFKPVHIPRPVLGHLWVNIPSNIPLVYNWVRRIATLAGKAVSMTIATKLVKDLHVRWEVMNTRSKDPYFGHLCFMPYGQHVKQSPANVVIGVQTPFGLNVDDFKEFARCRSFPDSKDVPLQGKYLSWAYLYDACQHHGTRWFALTSYSYWIFGAFNVGYATAVITPVYSYDTKAPTIVEMLAYWFASAREQEGTFVPPLVDGPIDVGLGQALRRRFEKPQNVHTDVSKISNRKDYWDGKDSEIVTAPSAFTRSEDSMTSSYPNSERMDMVKTGVRGWNRSYPVVPNGSITVELNGGTTRNQDWSRGEWIMPMQ